MKEVIVIALHVCGRALEGRWVMIKWQDRDPENEAEQKLEQELISLEF